MRELLFPHGIQFNELPAWQKRGVGIAWKATTKVGVNPKTGETTHAERRALAVDFELPYGDAYSEYARAYVVEATPSVVTE